MLGGSEQTFRRSRDRWPDEGRRGCVIAGSASGRTPARRATETLRMLELYEERYAGFTFSRAAAEAARLQVEPTR